MLKKHSPVMLDYKNILGTSKIKWKLLKLVKLWRKRSKLPKIWNFNHFLTKCNLLNNILFNLNWFGEFFPSFWYKYHLFRPKIGFTVAILAKFQYFSFFSQSLQNENFAKINIFYKNSNLIELFRNYLFLCARKLS